MRTTGGAMHTARRGLARAVGLLSLLIALGPAGAEELVVPGEHQGWGPPPFVAGSGRFQFVYDAALFSPGPVRITGLAFSPSLGVSSCTGGMQIRLGATATPVDALGTNLDANATGGLALVLDATLDVQDLPGGEESFTLAFAFDTPFDYDPALGNLLLDFAMTDIAFADPILVSSRTDASDGGSRAIDHPDVGTGADTIAPRIRLTLPEPGKGLGSATAMLALIARGRRRRPRPGC